MEKNIIIHEVGLRDGLQNESLIVDTETKLQWALELAKSNLNIIQLGSFVNPNKVPQMADTDKLFELIKKQVLKTKFSALILNHKGLERALQTGVDIICTGVSASNTHSLKNTGMDTETALETIIDITKIINEHNIDYQVSIQSAFGCGYEGRIDEGKVLAIATKLIDNGILNISLADTSGYAYPEKVRRIIELIKTIEPLVRITVHFHNTFGLGIANTIEAINSGAEVIETAIGGLGGCPFTKVAAGNVPTEDFVNYLQRKKERMDISLDSLLNLSKKISIYLNKELQSYTFKIGKFKL